MEFHSPNYRDHAADLEKLAHDYSLDPTNLKIIFYTPNCQAIVLEQVGKHTFKVHINLEEDRIISIQAMTSAQPTEIEFIKNKYRRYMT